MPSVLNWMEAQNNQNCQKCLLHIGLGYDSISRNSAADTNIHYPPPLYKLLTETPELHTNLLTPNLRWNKITHFQLMLFRRSYHDPPPHHCPPPTPVFASVSTGRTRSKDASSAASFLMSTLKWRAID